MLLAAVLGIFAGLLGTSLWGGAQFLWNSNLHQLYSRSPALFPILMGVFAALACTLVKLTGRATSLEPLQKHPMEVFFQGYRLGILRGPTTWVIRALLSTASALFGTLFGLEGAIAEFLLVLPRFVSRLQTRGLDERRAMLSSVLSAAYAAAFGVPISGALLSMESAPAPGGRFRATPIVAALSAYGTTLLMNQFVLTGSTLDSTRTRMGFLMNLFAGINPNELESSERAMLGAFAVGMGLFCALAAWGVVRVLPKGHQIFAQVFGKHIRTRLLFTGLVLGLGVWILPNVFSPPWILWDSLAAVHWGTSQALAMFFALASLFFIANSGWGSLGMVTPALLFGALGGYCIGNSFSLSLAVPLAIVGALSFFAVLFRAPLAAVALAFEVGHGDPIWIVCALGIVPAVLLGRFLKIESLPDRFFCSSGSLLLGDKVEDVLRRISVSEIMVYDCEMVSENAEFGELREAILKSRHNYVGVLTKEGKFLGLLSISQLPAGIKKLVMSGGFNPMIEIRELLARHSPTMNPGDTLEKVHQHLLQSDCIAVVDQERRFCGLVMEAFFTERYNREIEKNSVRLA